MERNLKFLETCYFYIYQSVDRTVKIANFVTQHVENKCLEDSGPGPGRILKFDLAGSASNVR
jgi:hypothetical protein